MGIGIPLTASDLRAAADVLDSAIKVFGENNYDENPTKNYTKFGRQFDQIDLRVYRDGALEDESEIIGRITYYDGWLGFYPEGED